MIKNSYYMPGTANTVLYVPQSAPKHGIPSTPRWEL